MQNLNVLRSISSVTRLEQNKMVLQRIELIKEFFALQLEQGGEVYVPLLLSQSKFPSHFRFYDPILRIAKLYMSPDKHKFFELKNQFSLLEASQKKNFVEDLKEKMFGMKMGHKLKVNIVPHRRTKEQEILSHLDYNHSKFTNDLQHSRYLSIDHDVVRFKKYKPHKPHNGDQGVDSDDDFNEDKQVVFKFCLPREVDIKHKKLLAAKGRFSMTVCKLKLAGRRLNLMAKIDNWIEEELDKIRNENTGEWSEVDLQKHHENLMKQVDVILKDATVAKYVKKLDKFHTNTNAKIEFQSKNKYVEYCIKKDMKFFQSYFRSLAYMLQKSKRT